MNLRLIEPIHKGIGSTENSQKEFPAVGLEFGVLGPLEVNMNGRGLTVGGPRQRAVLSALLLSFNQVVSFDALIEKVWNGRPPSTARTQVAICIATLRKIFRTAGLDRETIITATPGYMLSLTGHSLDSLRFEQLVARATELTAENRPAPAADALRQALALWRGPALGGVYAPFAETEAARLDEQRMLAVEQLTALRLQLGEHQSVLGELQALVGACPLRDRLRYYLMLAQYRSGRRAEALTTFRDGMRHSIEEIGLELGTDLQALHDSILRDEFPQLDVPGIAVQQRDRQQTVPTQLPESDAYFIGRSREQWLMDDVLLDGSAQNHSPIAYITGSPGIGKTSLAVNWAHRTAHRFPDGQLFADLREGDTLGVLHRFLRQLGAEGPLPTEPADAAERYRGMLEGRRVLIVLDHASSYTQVRHLLPTSGGCCVLITGRANLDELMQKYRALRLRVAPLSDDESRETLTSVLRDARAEESPEATSRLAGLCGHTPLALRAAAARLLTKTHWRVLDLVRRLERSGDRLAELSIGDDSLRARLDRSMRELDPRVASAYRELSRLDDTDFDAAQAAQVLGTDLLEAEDLIETLVDAQLLEAVGRGGAWGEMRYRWQELVRLHALHCLTAATPCGAALTD
ncbi:BTAD domain-containing putative transcriptional regulator [Streptomyces rochei]|uniref:Winged helix-turn-helix domain-containing protein n=1 Tax=Streptomyces vinaceusdrappus TaxID=67376 RepID=A0ABY6C719_9ACTN|nr:MULTISPECIES: BTAD domain-containing putative transcriptional regulator [Streptomyces]MBU8552729.1 AfsR/SARP family transcriptional regulator [Streptomyces sp. Osf17]MBU8559523.1 AfsR/SARP family transcriptional regulator [Streptomyces sp. Babs14]MBX4178131.1 winged helix-turn-helix domain-containing protein [Streptomyces geysiriensis]RSS31376.1 AfsR/SARP family transcriptional regulator [Streptomyces sp. WAC08452]UAX56666.1 winged helix-turn-helix domain-containing protein [Streptomyces sp